jgi:hypothetical protein
LTYQFLKTKKKRNVLTCPVSDRLDSNCLLLLLLLLHHLLMRLLLLHCRHLLLLRLQSFLRLLLRLHHHCYDGAFCVSYQPSRLVGPLLPL